MKVLWSSIPAFKKLKRYHETIASVQ